jgi:hypothetical protein
MEPGDVVLSGLPTVNWWFLVTTGATLSLQGPMIIQGTTNLGIFASAATSKLYANDVTFTGFGAPPLAVHGGSAYLDNCTFKANSATGISMNVYGMSSGLHDLRRCDQTDLSGLHWLD